MEFLQLLEHASRTFGVPVIALVAVWFVATYRSERKQDRAVMHDLAEAVKEFRDVFQNHESRLSRVEGVIGVGL